MSRFDGANARPGGAEDQDVSIASLLKVTIHLQPQFSGRLVRKGLRGCSRRSPTGTAACAPEGSPAPREFDRSCGKPQSPCDQICPRSMEQGNHRRAPPANRLPPPGRPPVTTGPRHLNAEGDRADRPLSGNGREDLARPESRIRWTATHGPGPSAPEPRRPGRSPPARATAERLPEPVRRLEPAMDGPVRSWVSPVGRTISGSGMAHSSRAGQRNLTPT